MKIGYNFFKTTEKLPPAQQGIITKANHNVCLHEDKFTCTVCSVSLCTKKNRTHRNISVRYLFGIRQLLIVCSTFSAHSSWNLYPFVRCVLPFRIMEFRSVLNYSVYVYCLCIISGCCVTDEMNVLLSLLFWFWSIDCNLWQLHAEINMYICVKNSISRAVDEIEHTTLHSLCLNSRWILVFITLTPQQLQLLRFRYACDWTSQANCKWILLNEHSNMKYI